jgi:Phage integrase family/Phage integrase, N-terminal SAM-like domain
MPEARGLYEVSREKMRTRHFAYHTEQAYLSWIRRYVNFHNRKHPREMGSSVLTVAEVRSVLAQLDGVAWLFANLLYGSGLRLMEALRLRVKDLVIERGELIVRDAKGDKDRVTVLPTSIVDPLRAHLAKLHIRFEQQRRSGEPGVSLPVALARKFPNSSRQWGLQYVFPAHSLCQDVYTGQPFRHHMHGKAIVIPGISGFALCRYTVALLDFSIDTSELPCPSQNRQIPSSSIPSAWCWGCSSPLPSCCSR